MTHLTQRAVEFLKAFPDKADYESEPGQTACRQRRVKGDDWCRVEDVRSILGKETIVMIDNHRGSAWIRDVQPPTCPVCAVMLDKLLVEKT
jgi:hypothetical protein